MVPPILSGVSTEKKICETFSKCFSEQLEIRGGASEPLYLPAREGARAQLFYRENFTASLLHEISHWCLAGPLRREKVDFGYTYLAGPRSKTEQVKFFSYEVKPQALEWIFAEAAGLEFEFSVDDFSNTFKDEITLFHAQVKEQKDLFLMLGLPERGEVFRKALAVVFNTSHLQRIHSR